MITVLSVGPAVLLAAGVAGHGLQLDLLGQGGQICEEGRRRYREEWGGKDREKERNEKESIRGLINGPGGGLERQAVGVVMGRQRPAIHSDCTAAPAI